MNKEYMHFSEAHPQWVIDRLNELASVGWRLITVTATAYSASSLKEYTAFLERDRA